VTTIIIEYTLLYYLIYVINPDLYEDIKRIGRIILLLYKRFKFVIKLIIGGGEGRPPSEILQWGGGAVAPWFLLHCLIGYIYHD
jgi:hypothetical protein